MNCQTCTGPMRLLFSSFYCPNDCDRQDKVMFDGARLFMWRGQRWLVKKVDRAPAGARSWQVLAAECDFTNWTEEQIALYGERYRIRADDQWSDSGPGVVYEEERVRTKYLTLWLFERQEVKF